MHQAFFRQWPLVIVISQPLPRSRTPLEAQVQIPRGHCELCCFILLQSRTILAGRKAHVEFDHQPSDSCTNCHESKRLANAIVSP